MSRRAVAMLAAVAAIVASSRAARAHEFRPAVLDLADLGGGRYQVTFAGAGEGEVSIAFPADCAREAGTAEHFVIRCERELAGRAITAHGLGAARADALVRFTGPGGAVTAVMRADSPSFVVPGAGGVRESRLARARTYFAAGVEHIAGGVDHLLFVLGLVLLVARDTRARRGAGGMVRAVTAFTLAHSITLALAATAAVRLPPAPVEAAIALSIVLLAGELARDPGAHPTLARRHPALMAFGFGLLHGFGFAGGLAELRVPASDLPLALAGFNLGVEAGQLAFVAGVLALGWVARAARASRSAAWAWSPALAVRKLAPAYVVGSIGAFFLIDRLTRLWTP